MSHRSGFVAACLLALAFTAPAQAVIMRLTPLKGVIDGSDQIVVATVEAVDPARPSMILNVSKDLKGTLTTRRLPVLLKGGPEGNPKQLLDRVKPGTELVLFMTSGTEQVMVNAFTEGSWFQIMGPIVEGVPRWGFTHGEPYLRRTFKGTTQEMKSTIAGYLDEKKSPPVPMPDEKPGFGPTLDGVAFEEWSPVKPKDGDAEPEKKVEAKPAPAENAPASTGSTVWIVGGIIAAAFIAIVVMAARRKA